MFQDVFIEKPFIFVVRDKQTGSILFMGRYKTPPAESGEVKAIINPTYNTASGNLIIIHTQLLRLLHIYDAATLKIRPLWHVLFHYFMVWLQNNEAKRVRGV